MTGAWYGAGLKVQQEFQQETKARREATPEEQLTQLEDRRRVLVGKRDGLQRKIADLKSRKDLINADSLTESKEAGYGKEGR
ncbi:MAG: hypothetical protein M1827_001149 [Pycnora praestabilis]|nr:MAG: hypothetical protein M1827_001149 [Pycnora praestabilis]